MNFHSSRLTDVFIFLNLKLKKQQQQTKSTSDPPETCYPPWCEKLAHIWQILSSWTDQVQTEDTNLTVTRTQSNAGVGIGGRGHVQREDTVLSAAHRLLVFAVNGDVMNTDTLLHASDLVWSGWKVVENVRGWLWSFDTSPPECWDPSGGVNNVCLNAGWKFTATVKSIYCRGYKMN